MPCKRREWSKGVNPPARRKILGLALLGWSLFAAGLLVQLLAPRLEIRNRAFVIPPSLTAGETAVHPEQIVNRARRMQLLSAALTVSGALGLAVRYRHLFTGKRS